MLHFFSRTLSPYVVIGYCCWERTVVCHNTWHQRQARTVTSGLNYSFTPSRPKLQGAAKKYPRNYFFLIFLAIAENFEAKFHAYLYARKSAKEHLIIFNCDKVIGFFLHPRRHFKRSRAAECAQNERKTILALQENTYCNLNNRINNLAMTVRTLSVHRQLSHVHLIF